MLINKEKCEIRLSTYSTPFIRRKKCYDFPIAMRFVFFFLHCSCSILEFVFVTYHNHESVKNVSSSTACTETNQCKRKCKEGLFSGILKSDNKAKWEWKLGTSCESHNISILIPMNNLPSQYAHPFTKCVVPTSV